jgi:hypothetical protein
VRFGGVILDRGKPMSRLRVQRTCILLRMVSRAFEVVQETGCVDCNVP